MVRRVLHVFKFPHSLKNVIYISIWSRSNAMRSWIFGLCNYYNLFTNIIILEFVIKYLSLFVELLQSTFFPFRRNFYRSKLGNIYTT